MTTKVYLFRFFAISSLTVFLFLTILIPQTAARNLNASMAYLPKVLESPDEGIFAEMVIELDRVYTEGKIIRKVYPFVRSMQNVIKGEADFHMPLIINPYVDENKLPFRHISGEIWDIIFVIYSRTNNKITNIEIEAGKKQEKFPYIIETDRAHTSYFDFPIVDSSAIESSLKQVRHGRIDAFIFAQAETDYVLKELKFKDIARAPFKNYKSTFVVQNSKKGREVDKILTKALSLLEKDGTMARLRKKIQGTYIEWQPSEMSEQ